MNIKVVNKEIIFAKYKIIATRTFGDSSISKEHITYDDSQKDEIVSKYKEPWQTEVENLVFDSEVITKAASLKGKVITKSEAIKKLTKKSDIEVLQETVDTLVLDALEG